MLRHLGSVQIVYRGGVFNLENRQLNYRSWWHSRSFIHWFAPVNETSRLMGWLALTRVENYIIQRGEVINTDTINILQKKQAAMLYITHNSLSCWWAEGSMALSVSLLHNVLYRSFERRRHGRNSPVCSDNRQFTSFNAFFKSCLLLSLLLLFISSPANSINIKGYWQTAPSDVC